MKKLIDFIETYQDFISNKLANIDNFADAFVRPLHLPYPIVLSYLAAFSEIVGSWLLITGLLARGGGEHRGRRRGAAEARADAPRPAGGARPRPYPQKTS